MDEAKASSGFRAQRAGELVYYAVPGFAREGGVRAAFSSRRGGWSRGPYSTLNLGLHVGDDPETVLKNRAFFCDALGLNHRDLVACAQVHGTEIAVVGAADRGRGALDPNGAVPGADGLATDIPGVPLVTFYGDCVPLFFYDPVRPAIALVHAGWRGTLGRIAARAVSLMRERFGASPERLLVGIGPSIGACCYTVGPEVAGMFAREFGTSTDIRHHPGAGGRLNLALLNRRILEAAGVRGEHIHTAPWCTSCHPEEFFSHRASRGTTGRMAAIMALE
ncbi:peptidoglycan editing factor PgeF [Candidatus Desulforudis audaxviator]|uniref:Purine nucleoside phosphorylase n=1 Tax=Desulforudis audaxviator (strain MP104C) TaxID=477974 RepID=B1I4C9_DESAP|nr:peptidoglycan editing factor PgeF [Candidatus Desulforudis audaxviator]ACA59927.1 protein of unknown function DUF152 [Candidatus Desulforudis audaxviator MP104C]AZK59940.1 hypothetical protein Daudx_1393 [Candidatus Desulforudis audaxviator]